MSAQRLIELLEEHALDREVYRGGFGDYRVAGRGRIWREFLPTLFFGKDVKQPDWKWSPDPRIPSLREYLDGGQGAWRAQRVPAGAFFGPADTWDGTADDVPFHWPDGRALVAVLRTNDATEGVVT